METNIILEPERWKYIPDTDKRYMISNHGRVKSRANSSKWRIKKPYKKVDNRPGKTGGHLRIQICYLDGTKRKFLVHRLVGFAFIPNPLNKPQINHIDGNKENNYYLNLEWTDQSENMLHASKVLQRRMTKKGEASHFAKLTQLQTEEIKELYATGKYSQAKIAAKYNVTQSTISKIILNKRWSHE